VSVSLRFEETLRVHGRHAAAPGGRDRLSIDVVLAVARREDARHAGQRRHAAETIRRQKLIPAMIERVKELFELS